MAKGRCGLQAERFNGRGVIGRKTTGTLDGSQHKSPYEGARVGNGTRMQKGGRAGGAVAVSPALQCGEIEIIVFESR